MPTFPEEPQSMNAFERGETLGRILERVDDLLNRVTKIESNHLTHIYTSLEGIKEEIAKQTSRFQWQIILTLLTVVGGLVLVSFDLARHIK